MDYKAMVNPTFLTAKSTVFMLAGAGNEDAKRMIEGLGLQDALGGKKQDSSPFSEVDIKALMTGTTLAVEARYAAVSRTLKTGEYKALLDIACGYTPRSIFCHKEGIEYRGLDVPVVTEELQKFADKEGMGQIYSGGDATNAASLLVASDDLGGPILISTEGLWGYLFKEEFEQLVDGVRQVLKNHGGAWISSDMGVDYEAFAIANMPSKEAAQLYQASRIKTMKDQNIYNEGVGYWEKDKVEALLKEHGLKIEVLPFYDANDTLNILMAIPDEWKEKYIPRLEESCIWKITLDETFKEKENVSGAKQIENLKIDYEVTGNVLNCSVSGRIDTISSPALLEIFEKNYDLVKSIIIDAKDLEYISSAGLRVLLMGIKKLGEGSVVVIHTSNAVKEIFATTGFDQMIEVK